MIVSAGHRKQKFSARKRLRIAQILRVALPVAAVLILAAAFLLSPNNLVDKFSLPLAREQILADNLRITSPVYQGTTPSGDAYQIEADWALPSGMKVQEVDLHNMRGTLHMTNGQHASMQAGRAVAKPREKHVILSNSVEVTTSDGYTLTTQEALVDGGGNTVHSTVPVHAQSQGRTLTAGRMTLVRDDQTQDIIAQFSGGVVVTFDPKKVP